MQKTQLVVTSQVDLPRTGFDWKLPLPGPDADSCRRLSRSFVRGDAGLDGVSEAQLLNSAEGRPPALRLIAALAEYPGSVRSALREISREGARVVEIPKQAKQNRETPPDRCLSHACRMPSAEELRLLFPIASCSAGLFSYQAEHYGGTVSGILAAALRRWSLVERMDVGLLIDRWYALTPIRSFAVRRRRRANGVEAKALIDKLPRDIVAMAGAIEAKAQDKSELPHMARRFWLEPRNLQLVVDESEANPSDGELAPLAFGVCSSMVSFFFVARLPRLGVRTMIRGARIAMRADNWKDARVYIAEAAGIAQR